MTAAAERKLSRPIIDSFRIAREKTLGKRSPIVVILIKESSSEKHDDDPAERYLSYRYHDLKEFEALLSEAILSESQGFQSEFFENIIPSDGASDGEYTHEYGIRFVLPEDATVLESSRRLAMLRQAHLENRFPQIAREKGGTTMFAKNAQIFLDSYAQGVTQGVVELQRRMGK